jgi:hypothetical protein
MGSSLRKTTPISHATLPLKRTVAKWKLPRHSSSLSATSDILLYQLPGLGNPVRTHFSHCKSSKNVKPTRKFAPPTVCSKKFRKNFRKANIFAKMFAKKNLPKIAKISCLRNVFTKMDPLFLMLLTSFAFSSKKLKEKSTFLIFRAFSRK